MAKKDTRELTNSIAEYKVVPINKIVPYWRNPYDNNQNAVDAVASSIEEFTYFNPIIVDKEGVIICGHTRYKALKKLGVEQVVVMVSDLDELLAKQYRIADNKTTELSSWLIDRVRAEYESLPSSKTLDAVFPSIMMVEPVELPEPATEPLKAVQATDEELDDVMIELLCPNCMNGFEARWGQLKSEVA